MAAPHRGISFGALHKARLKDGLAADLPTLPEGKGDIYYASDTQTLYVGQIRNNAFSTGFSNGFQTGSRWKGFVLPDAGTVTELSDLTDVSSASDAANRVLATPNSSNGEYAGVALLSSYIPARDTKHITGIVSQARKGTGLGQFSPGDLMVGDSPSGNIVRLPTGNPRQLLAVDTALNPKVKWTNNTLVGNNLKGARVFNSGTQTVNNATETTLAWNSESFDTDGCHDNVTNNERLTCQTAGYYVITAHINLTTLFTTTETNLALTIYLNGTVTIKGRVIGTLFVSTLFAMSVSDFVIVRLTQSRGASVTVASGEACAFMMMRVAP